MVALLVSIGEPTPMGKFIYMEDLLDLLVSGYITKEMQQRWLLCFPVSSPWSECVHLTPFGVIPKKGGNKWKLKVDLSSPHGASVHDGIDSAFTSICYSSINYVVRIIQSLGNGTLMAKLDLKAAYRSVPVHPEDRLLLGTWWEEGPSSYLVFLGIKIDSKESQLRLPHDKLQALKVELAGWHCRKACSK